jgi:aminoglycoside phosphotransferase (APT) family kinase protein
MRSQTQRDLTADEVAGLVGRWLGPSGKVVDAEELGGGGFAAVWRVALDDGREVVLKTSPPRDAVLLAYERGLLAAEAQYFELIAREAPELPVPRVLHQESAGAGGGADSAETFDGEWMVVTLLPGAPLSGLHGVLSAEDDHAVRIGLGRAIARLHALTGPHFGYCGAGRRQGESWRTVFLGIIDDLLADADRLGSELPMPGADVRRIIDAAAPVLDDVQRPAPVHFDLWDGNVLVSGGGEGGPDPVVLTGLVDGERWLYGDPLVDFVGPDLFGNLELTPEHPFVRGYAQVSGELRFTRSEVTRIKLYRAWLYLVMAVEVPTRAFGGDENAQAREDRVRRLGEVLAELTKLTGLEPGQWVER